KRKKVSINDNNIEVMDHKGNITKIGQLDVDYIEIYGHKNVLDGSNHRFTLFDDFYYLNIIDKSGNKIFLTSLLSKNLKEAILRVVSKEQVTFKHIFFPIIKR